MNELRSKYETAEESLQAALAQVAHLPAIREAPQPSLAEAMGVDLTLGETPPISPSSSGHAHQPVPTTSSSSIPALPLSNGSTASSSKPYHTDKPTSSSSSLRAPAAHSSSSLQSYHSHEVIAPSSASQLYLVNEVCYHISLTI